MNKLILSGNVTKDPEVIYSASGNVVAKFSIAVRRRFRNEKTEIDTDFIPLTCFGKEAEFAENNVKKGHRIEVICRVENNNYTNKDGQKVYGFQFLVEQIEFGGGSKKDSNGETEGTNGSSAPASSLPPVIEDDDDEDLPPFR